MEQFREAKNRDMWEKEKALQSNLRIMYAGYLQQAFLWRNLIWFSKEIWQVEFQKKRKVVTGKQ